MDWGRTAIGDVFVSYDFGAGEIHGPEEVRASHQAKQGCSQRSFINYVAGDASAFHDGAERTSMDAIRRDYDTS